MPFFLEIIGGTAIGTGLLIGIIGGLGDSLSSVLKALSGTWSDKIHRKKPFVAAGYAISATSKIFFPLSNTAGQVAIVRVAERTGKGIRDAPRDAIIAESSGATMGTGFGIHRALDTSGAIIGSIIALVFIVIYHPQNPDAELLMVLKITFFFAAILAFFALIPLIFVKSEAKSSPAKYKIGFRNLPRNFWYLVLIMGFFAFGNFTYMFFIFQTSQLFTLELAFVIPLALYIGFNVIYTVFSIPGGKLSDNIGKGNVLIIGYGFFALTCLTFIFSTTLIPFILGFCFYGIALALIDTVQRAFISDIIDKEVRGTALGTFHMITGLAALPAGIIAGLLYDFNPISTFVYGVIIGLASLFLLLIYLKKIHSSKTNSV